MKSRTPSNRGRPILEAEEGTNLEEDIEMGQDNQGPKSTMGAIQRFLNNTTAHGLPRISKARNQMGRGFWVAVWLMFFSVFCYQVDKKGDLIYEEKALETIILKNRTKCIIGLNIENYKTYTYCKPI
ncbi:hypothetical protein CRE_00504 [Caenorhabditis remanei]|uniref:Uncharacterized protein n=1 Tax=Caenorhabditis remanei TaxID=31234 RepID=E3LCJ5_CAERE|nr:hypothetical protein CRE_00504 [Caenorhabditis remanei]